MAWNKILLETDAVDPADHNHTAAAGDGGVMFDDEHDGYSEYAHIAAPGNPAAGKVRVYPKNTKKLYLLDEDGTETDLTVVGSIATDAIWDTAGDIVQGTGANTAVKLGIGAAGQILRVNAGATALAYVTGGVIQIAKTTLAVDTASIDWQNIPGTYSALRIAIIGRGNKNAANVYLKLTFNNDGGGNYDRVNMSYNGTHSTSETFASAFIYVGDMPAATAGAGLSGASMIEIPFYASTTFQKVVIAHGYYRRGTAAGNIAGVCLSGDWRNTGAIDRITIIPDANDFLAGTEAVLWGIP